MRTRVLILIFAICPLVAFPKTSGAQVHGVRAYQQPAPFTLNGLLSEPSYDATWGLIYRIYEGLFYWGDKQTTSENVTPDTEETQPKPALADSWRRIDGTRVYEFDLNVEAKWQDGVDFTAEDVVFTYRLALDSGLGSPYAQRLRDTVAYDEPIAEGALGFYAFDSDTFLIQSRVESDAKFLEGITLPIIPKHIWEQVAVDQWKADAGSTGTDAMRVVGTGEFTFFRRYQLAPCDDVSEDRIYYPDEEVDLKANSGFARSSKQWPALDEEILPTYLYTCTLNGLTPDDRYQAALKKGIAIRPGEIDGIDDPWIPDGVKDWKFDGSDDVAESNPPPSGDDTGDEPIVIVEPVAVEEVDPAIIEVLDVSILEELERNGKG